MGHNVAGVNIFPLLYPAQQPFFLWVQGPRVHGTARLHGRLPGDVVADGPGLPGIFAAQAGLLWGQNLAVHLFGSWVVSRFGRTG